MVPVPHGVPNEAGERDDTVTGKGETFRQGALSEELWTTEEETSTPWVDQGRFPGGDRTSGGS